MRLKPTILLLAVAAALAALYFAVERPRRASENRQARDAALVVPAGLAGATAITLDRPDGRIDLEIVGTHWEMRSPLEDVAEQANVGRLLSALESATIERNLGVLEDTTGYGFDPAACVITVDDADDVSLLDLTIGNYNPDRSSVYALRDGEVLLIPTAVRRYALFAVEDFRSRRVVSFDLDNVASFYIEGAHAPMTWTRDGSAWTGVSGSDTLEGDPVAVESVLRRLRGLRARAFPDPASAAAFFPGDGWHIDIEKKDGAPGVTLEVAPVDEDRYYTHVLGETRYVEVDTAVAPAFRAGPDDLRERRMLRFDPADIGEVSITTPDTSGTLRRTGERWVLPNPALGTVDGDRAAALVRLLASTRCSGFAGAPPAGIPPSYRVAIRSTDGTLVDEASIYRDGSGRFLVEGKRLDGIGIVDGATIERIEMLFRRTRNAP